MSTGTIVVMVLHFTTYVVLFVGAEIINPNSIQFFVLSFFLAKSKTYFI